MENTHPQISVIVALLNKAKEVCRAIDSIFAQTVQDFEVIIVDGGSTDGSLEAIKKYESDSRFHILHQKTKGVSNGRNEGIAAAFGELIAFLDADDEWMPEFLETILYLREKYPDAGLYATAYSECTGDYAAEPRLGSIPKAPWDGIISPFKAAAEAFIYPFMTSSVAVPKRVLENVGVFNPAYQMGEDSELWGRIALEYPVAFSSSVGTKYSMTADNKLTHNPPVVPKLPFAVYLETYPEEKLKSRPDYEEILIYLQKEEISMALNNLYAGAPDAARNNLKRVHEKQFMKYKTALTALSYLPSPLLKKILPIANSLGRNKV